MLKNSFSYPCFDTFSDKETCDVLNPLRLLCVNYCVDISTGSCVFFNVIKQRPLMSSLNSTVENLTDCSEKRK